MDGLFAIAMEESPKGRVPVMFKLMPPRSRFSRQSSVGCPQGLVDRSTDVDILEKNLWCPWWNGFFARFLFGKCWAKMNIEMGYPQQGSFLPVFFFNMLKRPGFCQAIQAAPRRKLWRAQPTVCISATPSRSTSRFKVQTLRLVVQPLTRCIIACGFIIK